MELSKNEKLLHSAVLKAWDDNSFKHDLLKDANTAIESLTGEKLELNDKKLIVIDENDSSIIYYKLPTKDSVMEIELTDEQLEKVAGGKECSVDQPLTIIQSCFCPTDSKLY